MVPTRQLLQLVYAMDHASTELTLAMSAAGFLTVLISSHEGSEQSMDLLADCMTRSRTQAVWSDHLTCMRSVGFNATTPVYVASGLFSYDTQKGKHSLDRSCRLRLNCRPHFGLIRSA